MPVENDASRPSTMETYTTSEETRGPECEENDAMGLQEKGQSLGKQEILRMRELPPEIRETYVFQCPLAFGKALSFACENDC